jgi:hypothetical protein
VTRFHPGVRNILRPRSAPAVGLEHRPLGPARFDFVTGEDFYTAVLDRRITTLVSFGGNMLMAHADDRVGTAAGERPPGRASLRAHRQHRR